MTEKEEWLEKWGEMGREEKKKKGRNREEEKRGGEGEMQIHKRWRSRE